jgi:diketogulonate reductase-like aldo/keto reductase
MLSLSSRTKLNNGVEMPWFGLGVYLSKPGMETYSATLVALQHGYRLIDTARAYRNERDVGAGISDSKVARSEIFVTTKLWNSDQGYDSTLRAHDSSRQALGVDAIDLYLIHWPVAGLRKDSWRAMVRLLEEKQVRAIGVSNYTVRHLEQLATESPVAPAVNQVEFSPFLFQKELLAYCNKHDIRLEAYGPLTQGQKLDHPTVAEVAKAHSKTPAQVLLRWVLQHEVIAIPKSVKPERIRENAALYDFTLSDAEMKKLDALDENFRTSWDPTQAA